MQDKKTCCGRIHTLVEMTTKNPDGFFFSLNVLMNVLESEGISDYTRIRVSGRIHFSLFGYIVIFLKRYAPATVIASAKPPITARQTTGLIWDTPVRPYRIPSTP